MAEPSTVDDGLAYGPPNDMGSVGPAKLSAAMQQARNVASSERPSHHPRRLLLVTSGAAYLPSPPHRTA